MERAEKLELKRWLTGLLPADISRNDVAEEFGVTRKTVSGMLNPDSVSFGNGLTMLRYLRLVGAVTGAPVASPASSRLEALREAVAEVQSTLTDDVVPDLSDVIARLARLEAAVSPAQAPPNDQAVGS